MLEITECRRDTEKRISVPGVRERQGSVYTVSFLG